MPSLIEENPSTVKEYYFMTSPAARRIFPSVLTYTRERLVAEISLCMKECRLSLRAFAMQCGVTYDNMKDFMWGRTQMFRGDKLQKVVAFLQQKVPASEMSAKVPIIGEVGAGGEVYPIDDLPLLPRAIDPAEQDYVNCEWVDAPPGLYWSGVVALRVTGDSMKPFMPPGTVVYYAERFNDGVPDHCLSSLCVVQLRDGRTLLKLVRKSHLHGKFDLQSYNMDTIADVELAWCAPVIFIKPFLRNGS
jgi:predicted XRE-type DNA-binding protein